MTDKEIMDYVFKTQTRVCKKFDYVGALKHYCAFLASGEKSFTGYERKHHEGVFGYKNEQSFIAGVPQVYRKIKKLLGRDFWQDVVEKPELEIIPPKKKEICFTEFMASVMLSLEEIKKTLKNIQSIDGAHYQTVKERVKA